MADHGQLPLPRFTTVNVAIATPHRSGASPNIRACDIDQRFAEGGASSLVADQRGKDVALLQRNTAGYADGLLAYADINATRNATPAIHAGEFFLKRAGQKHPAKRLEVFLVDWRFGWGFFLLGSRRLQHRTIVANISAGAQKIFAGWLALSASSRAKARDPVAKDST